MRQKSLPALARPRIEIERRLRERIALGVTLQNRPQNNPDDMVVYMVEVGKWRDYNFELIKRYFNDQSLYSEYDTSTTGSYVEDFDAHSLMQIPMIMGSVSRQIAMLESIIERLELIDEGAADGATACAPQDRSKVFVVHGHDEGALQATPQTLGRRVAVARHCRRLMRLR
jgi:hypothetical protein